MQLEIRLMKVPDKSSAYKKLKEKLLISFTSKSFAHEILTTLLSFPQLGGLLTVWNSNLFDGTVV